MYEHVYHLPLASSCVLTRPCPSRSHKHRIAVAEFVGYRVHRKWIDRLHRASISSTLATFVITILLHQLDVSDTRNRQNA